MYRLDIFFEYMLYVYDSDVLSFSEWGSQFI